MNEIFDTLDYWSDNFMKTDIDMRIDAVKVFDGATITVRVSRGIKYRIVLALLWLAARIGNMRVDIEESEE